MHFSRILPVVFAAAASAQLNQLTVQRGKEYFGSATDNNEITDAPYKAILTDTTEFGQITPGNAQKWAYSEPQQGVFDHRGGDEIINLAQASGQLVRCHTLVWHSQAPGWINSPSVPWTNATLIAAMKNHIKEMVTHYKGKCHHWDVVNEAFEEDGSYRVSPFSSIIGPEFIPIAFQTAAEYDPDTKLYYNDYNFEYNGAKAEAGRKLIASMKARGIKVDGVGFQAHMIVGGTPGRSSLTSLLNSFTTLGVDVAYTELDVRHESLPPSSTAIVQQQNDWVNLVMSCFDVARCVGLTIWDYTDKYSWIPSVFPGQGDALLWDKYLVKKSAYTAVANAIKSISPVVTSTTRAVTSTTTRVSTTLISPSTTTPIASATTTRSATTLSTTTRTSAAQTTTTSASSGPLAQRWGQCGGLGWTGPKACTSPYTCKYSNDWYSQCL